MVKLRLREYRELRGLSIRGLADQAGVSFPTVWRIEAGRMSPTVAMLEKLAAALKVAVPVEEVGPTTLAGFTDNEDKLAVAAAAWGVKRRVAENGPNTPAEFCARTRHHSRCAGKPPMIACDTLTIWFAMNGAEMVEELSIWIS